MAERRERDVEGPPGGGECCSLRGKRETESVLCNERSWGDRERLSDKDGKALTRNFEGKTSWGRYSPSPESNRELRKCLVACLPWLWDGEMLANKKERATSSPPVCLTVCPRPRSRLACLSVGLRSRRIRSLPTFTPQLGLLPTRTGSSLPAHAREKKNKKPRAIIMAIASASTSSSSSSLSLSLSSPARCHHETPLLVSPYIHGVVLYSRSL